MTTTLIPLARLPAEVPTWPYSPWSTGHMIRTGLLGCVRVGRRVYVTAEILEAFAKRHTVQP
jgi:hypothetical protein